MEGATLDQLPSNIQIVDSRGFPTNPFVFYLLKLLKKNTQESGSLDALTQQVDLISQKTTSTSMNYTVLPGNYSIIVDATSGTKIITMPLANSAKNLIIGVTKKDATTNSVTIQASGTDLICGATSHALLRQYEVLNFISDGTSWQLAN